METTKITKCPKCGGEMKEINPATLKCEKCGEIVHKNEHVAEEMEEKDGAKKI